MLLFLNNMATYLIPLDPTPQTFQIQLNGVNYSMTVKYNSQENGGWQFDLTNADTNTPVVAGVPIITGADCLENLGYLGIGGAIVALTDGDPYAVPTFENLGINSNLYFVTP